MRERPDPIPYSRAEHEFGLIRVTPVKPKPLHVCKTPGLITRTLLAFTFQSIPKGSMYRCPSCGKIYRLMTQYDSIETFFLHWRQVNGDEWFKLFGELPPLLLKEKESPYRD